MVWPNLKEVAKLTVNGVDYKDWETVWVKHTMQDDPHYSFRFTCSEGMPLSKNIKGMQINVGYPCDIELAGQPAFHGLVSTRQVFYDSKRHHIEIMGQTNHDLAASTVAKEGMEWPKGTEIQKIVTDVLKPLGIPLKVEGGSLGGHKTDETVRATHGEVVHDFLDKITRHVPGKGVGIAFTSNVQGDFVIILGPNQGEDAVVEGQNIIEGRELIYSPSIAKDGVALGQATPNDKTNGAKASQANFPLGLWNVKSLKSMATSFMEMATTSKALMSGRMTNERNWLTADKVTVWATVYGWEKPSGGLWHRNDMVTVKSPMLVLNGVPLQMRSATFTQDDRTGTRTILELQNPFAFYGYPEQLSSTDTGAAATTAATPPGPGAGPGSEASGPGPGAGPPER